MTHYGALNRAANALAAAASQSAELPCEEAAQLLKDANRAAVNVIEGVIEDLEAEAVS